MSTTQPRLATPRRGHPVLESSAAAVAAIWLSAALISVLAPDMVSGSEHEHLPLALMTVWLWAAVGTAYALMTPPRDSRASWTIGVAVVWLLALVTAVAAPVMVTGSDPTRIPLGAIIAPPVAAVVTGLLSLHQANREDDRRERPRAPAGPADTGRKPLGPVRPREHTGRVGR